MVKKELQKVLASNLSKQNVIRIQPQQLLPCPQAQPMHVEEQQSEQPNQPLTEEAETVKDENVPEGDPKIIDGKDDSFVLTPDYIQQSKFLR